MNGFLVVDKPVGLTSHDVVAMLRAVTGQRRIGHTGTLDPFATGVLVLAMGHATKLIQDLDESHKTYDATIALGTATDTGDPTGEVVQTQPVPEFSADDVLEVLAGMQGERMQTPPAFSAVKHEGRPLYWYARRGIEVSVPARPIVVHGMQLLGQAPGELRVRIHCGRGTYARGLAEEIAAALGTVGHLSALARLRSGPFLMEDAIDLDWLAGVVAEQEGAGGWADVLRRRPKGERVAWKDRDTVVAALIPRMISMMAGLAHLPIVDVTGTDARRARHGHAPGTVPPGLAVGDRYLVAEGDELIAVAELSSRGARMRKVMPTEA